MPIICELIYAKGRMTYHRCRKPGRCPSGFLYRKRLVQRAAEVLNPLYKELCAQLKKCPYLLADETPFPVLKGTTPGSLHQGYIWAFYNTKDRYPLFEYCKSRNYDGVKILFTSDVKTVQSDGYGAYEVFEARRGSLIGKAVEYMYVRLEKLTHYTTDGGLMIDTNLIERSVLSFTSGIC